MSVRALLAGFAGLLITSATANAQTATYTDGSIYDLDPSANQATHNRVLEQIHESNDMQLVSEMSEHDILRKLARPVGRLALQLDNGKVGYCTASLISRDLIITNHHCIPGTGKVEAALLWMGYIIPRSRKGVAQYAVETTPVESNKTLDYSILRVRGNPGDEWGTISLSSDAPISNQSLFLIHHPGGFAQHITRGRCQTHTPATDGDDMFHRCDTLGGSSGAPIFDNNTRNVIGLHYSAVSLQDYNAGKQFASVAKTSEIIGSLVKSEEGRPPAVKNTSEDVLAMLRKKLADLEERIGQKPADKPSPPTQPEAKPSKTEADPSRTVESTGWSMQGGDLSNRRYSSLSQINSKNASQLRVAWSAATGVLRGHEGEPLVVDDTMYVHTPFPNNVFALNLEDGSTRWAYEPKQDPSVIPVMCCDTVNRGLAHHEGMLFLYQADSILVALDARTGREIWKVVNGDPTRAEPGTGAPLVADGKVIVGSRGDEFGVRGSVTAYDAKTGRRIWRAYSTGPDQEILFDPNSTTHLGKPVGRNSGIDGWKGDQWKIGGGTAWGWFSYDPDQELIFYGTSNPGTWNPGQRPGDNKWANSIIARDVNTGIAKWVYQVTPHDEWNYDSTSEMILVDMLVRGTRRKALIHFDSNGFAYTMDRETGELLVAEKFDPSVNWASHVDLQSGRPSVVARYSTDANGEDVNTKNICPTSAGAKNSQPAAYSPKSGLFYVPTNHMCMDFEPFRVSYTAGQPYVGATLAMYPPPGDTHRGNFIAWDADAGKIVWLAEHEFPVWSGALATAGDVVFYGTLKGELVARDTRDGKELFKYRTSSGIVGNVMTYAYEGKQYVAVYSGVGSWVGIGLAAGLTDPTSGLGMVGAVADLSRHTRLGGQVVVFTLP